MGPRESGVALDPARLMQLEVRARYALVAAMAPDKRVVDLGFTSSPPEARGLLALQSAGARELSAVAPSPDELRRNLDALGAQDIAVSPCSLPLPFADESADVLICFDLPQRAAKDPRWLAEARRVLASDGTLVVAVVGPKGPLLAELGGAVPVQRLGTVEEAFILLAGLFGQGVVFGQSPLVGSMFFDFEVEDPEPEIDRGLLDGDDEEPGWYVIVFGSEAAHSDKLTLVQLPFAEVVERVQAATVAERSGTTHNLEAATYELGQAHALINDLATSARAMKEELKDKSARVLELEELLAKQFGSMKRTIDERSFALQGTLDERTAVMQATLYERTAELEEARVERVRVERELVRHRMDRATLEAQVNELLRDNGERREAQGRLEVQLEGTSAELDILRAELERERMSNVQANEALRQEKVRGEQLLARLLQLENEQQSLD